MSMALYLLLLLLFMDDSMRLEVLIAQLDTTKLTDEEQFFGGGDFGEDRVQRDLDQLPRINILLRLPLIVKLLDHPEPGQHHHLFPVITVIITAITIIVVRRTPRSKCPSPSPKWRLHDCPLPPF